MKLALLVISQQYRDDEEAGNRGDESCHNGDPQMQPATLQINYALQALESHEQVKLPRGKYEEHRNSCS